MAYIPAQPEECRGKATSGESGEDVDKVDWRIAKVDKRLKEVDERPKGMDENGENIEGTTRKHPPWH